jgi:replicative DNA helicase
MSNVTPFMLTLRAGLDELTDAMNGQAPRPKPEWLETGLDELDHILGGGLKLGELTVWSGYTGGGKSAIADQIALNVSRSRKTVYYAYEMGRRRTTDRLLAKMLRTDVNSVANALSANPIPETVKKALTSMAYEHALKLDEVIDEVPNTVDLCLSLALAEKARLIIIDDLTYFDEWYQAGYGRSDLPMKTVMRRLKKAAEVLNAHIMCVHQTKSSFVGSKPGIADLADAHHVAKVADAVVMIHRPFRGQGINKDSVVELLVEKNRNGPAGVVHVEWYGRTMSYRTMLPQDQEDLACCKPRGERRVANR